MGVFPLDIGHGVINALADVRLFGGSLHHGPGVPMRAPKRRLPPCIRRGLLRRTYQLLPGRFPHVVG